MLHRWLKEHRQRMLMLSAGVPAPAFIPIDLAASLPVLGSDGEPSAPPSNIRIELQHHAMTVKRSVIPIEMVDVDRWLAGTVKEASALLQLGPVEVFRAGPA